MFSTTMKCIIMQSQGNFMTLNEIGNYLTIYSSLGQRDF